MPGDVGGNIGLVLMVGINNLDRYAQHLATKILNRHLGGFNRRLATKIGINTGLVVQNTNLDLAVRCVSQSH